MRLALRCHLVVRLWVVILGMDWIVLFRVANLVRFVKLFQIMIPLTLVKLILLIVTFWFIHNLLALSLIIILALAMLPLVRPSQVRPPLVRLLIMFKHLKHMLIYLFTYNNSA